MNIEPCTKVEANILRRHGHQIFARLDSDMNPDRYFATTISNENKHKNKTSKSYGARRGKVMGNSILKLVERDHIFTRGGSIHEEVYSCMLKVFLRDDSTIKRDALQKAILQKLSKTSKLSALQIRCAVSHFIHKENILQVV